MELEPNVLNLTLYNLLIITLFLYGIGASGSLIILLIVIGYYIIPIWNWSSS